jgi:hypothetical protein
MSRSKYDDKGLPWLRVKKWEEYQPSVATFRKKDAALPWIRDYTNKLEKPEFTQLLMYERALFEQVCLLVAKRPLRTVVNHPTWLSQALHMQPSDIPHVGHALSTLISRGLFIPIVTEEIFENSDENSAGDGEREGNREGERDSSVSQSVSVIEADASLVEEEEKGFKVVDLEVAVSDLPCFTLLHEGFGRSEMLPEPTVRRIHSALVRLEKTPAWMQGCIQYVSRHKWWKERVTHAEAFAKALINGINDPEGKKLPAQYDKHTAQRRAAGVGRK